MESMESTELNEEHRDVGELSFHIRRFAVPATILSYISLLASLILVFLVMDDVFNNCSTSSAISIVIVAMLLIAGILNQTVFYLLSIILRKKR